MAGACEKAVLARKTKTKRKSAVLENKARAFKLLHP
jgi:hypothetical protein